ncbi:MAG: AEC family transporter [Acidiferrobacterales bacterium]|nr:AEC family transporter [Acidiferrobacterales bacterium]
MLSIFLQVVPFFALIALGYGAVRIGFVTSQAIAHLTQFVFYFAISAMLFEFASKLPISEIFDLEFVVAYGAASLYVYLLVFFVARMRKCGVAEASVEAQCSVIGNMGFLAIPMLISIFGEKAATPVLLILTVDLVFFGSLIVAVITGSKDGRLSPGVLKTIGTGLIKNPMIMSIVAGLAWSVLDLPTPRVTSQFLLLLGAAATPCALFAIGGSLVERSAERVSVAVWLSFAKLVLHPMAVCFTALVLFDIDPFYAAVMIASAAMPVAGNIYIIAQHYGVAPQRASASILMSTVFSVVTLTFAIAMVSTHLIELS